MDSLEEQYVDALARQNPARYAPGFAAASEDPALLARGRLDEAYGRHQRQRFDLFCPPDQPGPVPLILFFHGGYWRANSKESRRFLAAAWLDRGVAFALANYRIVPHGTLEDMIDDARACLAHLLHRATELGVDRGRVVLAGNSAGAHLAAMAGAGAAPGSVKALCLLSGLYHLTPLCATSLAPVLALDAPRALRCSPLQSCPLACPTDVYVGALESPAFIQQSRALHALQRACGADSELGVLEGHDHFSIIAELGAPDGPIGRAISARIGAR